MKERRPGSALILVFSLIAVMGIVSIAVIRSGTLFYAFALDRMAHARKILAVESLTWYAIARCHEHPEKSWNKVFSQWPTNGAFEGRVSTTSDQSKITICASLSENNVPICAIKCVLKNENNLWSILTWLNRFGTDTL